MDKASCLLSAFVAVYTDTELIEVVMLRACTFRLLFSNSGQSDNFRHYFTTRNQ